MRLVTSVRPVRCALVDNTSLLLQPVYSSSFLNQDGDVKDSVPTVDWLHSAR